MHENLNRWQEKGLVPDWPIEPGEETTRLLRERGWTHWHHLFPPRHLLIGALIRKHMRKLDDPVLAMGAAIGLCRALNYMSKLTQWLVGFSGSAGVAPSADTVKHVFYNQALNTFVNYGVRAFLAFDEALVPSTKTVPVFSATNVVCEPASELSANSDIWIHGSALC